MPRSVVGRDAEAAQVAGLLAEDRPAVVVGEAGIGKTTLVRAVASASGRPAAEGGALATLSWMQYLPLERALGRSFGGADATAVTAAVTKLVGSGVLVLDDLQWADAGTLEVTIQLAGRLGLLAGVRRGDGDAPAVLERLRAAGFVEVPLTPLGPEDAGAVVRSLRPDLGDSAVRRVVDRTGGNPLLLRELTASGEPSASLRLAIAARLRTLDAVGRDAFAMLALAGRPMVAGELDDAGVKSLLEADLVVETATGIAVRHALLAEVMVDQLQPDELASLHRLLARVVSDEGERARHFQLAGARDEAFAAAMKAAADTDRPGEQAAHLGIAAACASGSDALRLRAAVALERVHDLDAMTAVLDLIDTANRDASAEACLLRARAAWSTRDTEGLRRHLDQGLALVGGTGTDVEVKLLIESARVPIFLDVDIEGGVASAESALTLARRTGVDIARAEYLYGTALVVADQPGGDEHLRTAIEVARVTDDVNTEFQASGNLVTYYESGESPATGMTLVEQSIRRANDLGLGRWDAYLRVHRTLLEFHLGDYRNAVHDAEALLEQPSDARDRDSLVEVMCVALIDLGRIDEALRLLEREPTSDDYRGTIQSTWIRTEAALWGGQPATALELSSEILQRTEQDPNLEFFRVTRAWAAHDLGRDPGPAAPEHPRAMLRNIPLETEGIRQLCAGEDGRDSFLAAARGWAPFHRRGELRCLWAAGEAARAAGDRDAAITLLEQAEARISSAGFLPLLARVHRSLRAAGVRRSAPRTHDPDDLLTGRQREVLRLVGAGLTNAEIAQRLGISRHTVVTQVGSAVTKLGATGRTHAAALAGEAG
jgi:DNA-binding CsgD family transcriptional regulator